MSDPKNNAPDSAASSGATTPPKSTEPGEAPAPNELTKEEQWARFEEELKESDWGHQPC